MSRIHLTIACCVLLLGGTGCSTREQRVALPNGDILLLEQIHAIEVWPHTIYVWHGRNSGLDGRRFEIIGAQGDEQRRAIVAKLLELSPDCLRQFKGCEP
jgi:hypothetical protein